MMRAVTTGFSIVELIIVVAVLGILAALVVPQFHGYSVDAKESVAKEGLRMLRSGIEIYTAQNTGIPPGYVDNNPQGSLDAGVFVTQLTTGSPRAKRSGSIGRGRTSTGRTTLITDLWAGDSG